MELPNASFEETRPPTVEDLAKLCEELNKEKVKYILIGGFAMIYHGLPRATEDIDLFVDSSSENVERLKKALSYLPDKAIYKMKPTDIEEYQVVRIADEFVIDLIKNVGEITYKDIGFERVFWRNIEIIVADLETMIKFKERSVRQKDKEDLIFLKLKKKKG